MPTIQGPRGSSTPYSIGTWGVWDSLITVFGSEPCRISDRVVVEDAGESLRLLVLGLGFSVGFRVWASLGCGFVCAQP